MIEKITKFNSEHMMQSILDQFGVLIVNPSFEEALNVVLGTLASKIRDIMVSDGCVIEIVDGPEVVYRGLVGLPPEYIGMRLPLDNSLSGLVFSTNKTLISGDVPSDSRCNREACARLNINAMIISPILLETKVIGVMKTFWFSSREFTEWDVLRQENMADLISTAIAEITYFAIISSKE